MNMGIQDAIRNIVSKKKRRFKADGFDLDLTYVTKRIIAMGFPASDLEGTFRNNIEDVTAFFDSHHPGHYKFYNLCSERTYPPHRFHGCFVRFPFDDHNPPPMGMFYFFSKDCENYLRESPENVVAIHCKAGKGRTGVMITAYLLWSGAWSTPDEAMKFYGCARTNNQKGVTIPSQRRFVNYFHECLSAEPKPLNVPLPSPPPAPVKALAAVSLEENGGGGGDSAASTPSTGGLRSTMKKSIVDDDGNVIVPPCQREDSDSDEEEDDDFDSGATTTTTTPKKRKKKTNTADGGGGSGIFSKVSLSVAVPPELETKTLSAADLTEAMGRYTALLYKTGAPGFKTVRRLMNDEWNRQNRVQTRGFRGGIPPPKILAISEIRIHHGNFSTFSSTYEPIFRINCNDFRYSNPGLLASKTYKTAPELVLDCPNMLVSEEVFVTFYSKSALTGSKAKAFCFWFHTSFVKENRLYLAKEEIDKACKDKKHSKFSAKFAIELRFVDPTSH